MIRIGEYNTLKVDREVDFGMYITDGEEDVLLPSKYIPKGTKVGDDVEVFVYTDSEDRPIATNLKPNAAVGEFGYMEVKDVTEIGAFLDWGLEKDLFVPFKAQQADLVKGEMVVVKVVLDEVTDRVMGVTRIRSVLDEYIVDIDEGQEVDLMVYGETELGMMVIINNQYSGLVYKNEIFEEIQIGDTCKGYVKKLRDDEKLDITLRKPGYDAALGAIPTILNMLTDNNGFLPYHSKSDPEDIKRVFQMSKKVFKQAIGGLYKERKIVIENDGIRLVVPSQNR